MGKCLFTYLSNWPVVPFWSQLGGIETVILFHLASTDFLGDISDISVGVSFFSSYFCGDIIRTKDGGHGRTKTFVSDFHKDFLCLIDWLIESLSVGLSIHWLSEWLMDGWMDWWIDWWLHVSFVGPLEFPYTKLSDWKRALLMWK